MQNSNHIFRLTHVKLKTGLSRSTIYALMKSSNFPQSVKLSERAVGWLESDINDWVCSRVNKYTYESSNQLEGAK